MSTKPLIVCLDVDYRDSTAVAAGLWFRGWDAAEASQQAVVRFDGIAAYEP